MMETEGDAQKGEIASLDPLKIKGELNLVDPDAIKAETEDPELEKKAGDYAEALLSFDSKDFKNQEAHKSAVENMGLALQRTAARRSQMLQEPIRKLSQRGADGGEVANALIELKMKVEELDPAQLDLKPGWFSRMAGKLPVVGTRLKRYFSRYESSETIMDAIIRSLQRGQDQLKRDNGILVDDQIEMRELTLKLEKAIKLGRHLDRKLEEKMTSRFASDEQKYRFIQEELIFPLRQRIIDLQQQLAVSQQGVLAMEIIIRNNKELIRGVNRALDVTVNALQVGVVVALALVNQKIVLDKIEALNTTTSNLLRDTAARLKTQGVAIQKQASSAMLQMEALKSAFADVRTALEDISNYRLRAVEQMSATIQELAQMTKEGEEVIKRMEDTDKTRPAISIEVE